MQKWDGFMLNLDSCGGAQCQKWQELFALGRYRGWEIWSICYSDHFSDGRKQGSQLNHVPFSLSFQATKSNLAQTNGSGHGTHFFQYLWWLIHWIIPYIIWFQYCRDNLQENLYLAETHGFRSGTRWFCRKRAIIISRIVSAMLRRVRTMARWLGWLLCLWLPAWWLVDLPKFPR